MTATPAVADTAPLRHLYLVDGSGYIFRAYFALQPMSTSEGVPTNAAFGFTNMLIKLLRESDADGLAVIFDKGRTSFRNGIYPDYKAQRPDPPEDLVPQFAMIREATQAFGLPCIEMEHYEADDLIATYARIAREAGVEVIIVSSDKDLMQLVGDGITMLDPIKNTLIGREQVIEKFGVPPEQVVDVQALAGDTVDNIPGVPGIGVKTAAQLIQEFGSLDALLARADEIKQPKRRQNLIEFADQARISRELVCLKNDVPVEGDLLRFRKRTPDPAALRAFLERYQFRSLLARLNDQLGTAPTVAPTPPAGAETGYELVSSVDRLASWIERAVEQGFVALRTTTGSHDDRSADLVGISLALAPGTACYIPLAHRSPEGRPAPPGQTYELDFDAAPEAQGEEGGGGEASPRRSGSGPAGGLLPGQMSREEALAALKPLLEEPSVLKIGQNLKNDMLVLRRCGVAVRPIDDVMLLSYALDAGRHGHDMDELADLHLGYGTIKFGDVAGSGRNQVAFDLLPIEKARDNAAERADVALRLHRLLKPRLVEEHMVTLYETIERPLVPVLVEMEAAGIKVDAGALQRLSSDFAQRIAALEEEIYRLAGRRFTIGSPKQLGLILFDEMGLDSGARRSRTKSGAHATGAEVLEALAAQGHELPARVLDWRQLTKLKSTYSDALQQEIDPRTGRVHTDFSQAVASTGRLSSNNPNLQNIPVRTEEGRKIRAAFVAQEGCRLLSVDYSQIELRLTAHVAGVDALKEAFRQGHDIHAMTASQVFGVPIEGMDPMLRRRAKAINFGIIYGISAFGLANNLGIPQAEARAYIDAYFERYPGIRAYMDEMRALARRQGYVTTLFGRRIHIPAIAEKNPSRRSFGERAAINAPIQGSAADIIKRAMIRVRPALAARKLSARLLLQVHDELLLEVPEPELEETAAVVREVMEGAAGPAVELSVPLVADVGIGATWAEAH